MKRLDLVGQRFGRLLVLEFAGISNHSTLWKCRCDCGTVRNFFGKAIKKTTKSCGCVGFEKLSKRMKTHGLTGTVEYAIWSGIKARCYNKKVKKYPEYGGRGITVCDEWKYSFETFLADMGERPFPTASIERIDNNLSYCKGNCKWATNKEQAGNRRSSKLLTYNGETKILEDWANILGVDHAGINFHLNKGRSFDWIYNHFNNKK